METIRPTGGDGVVTAITISPIIPETVIISDALGTMIESFDSGQSWEIK
jgi:hypothetical protein